jgi:UDP-2,3-diacylglucosamine hydrolase
MRGLVISDLHLMARRSVGEEMLGRIAPQIRSCEALVLNGDTFDFRWSTHREEARSIAAALERMECLLDEMDGRALHFIHGNHDCLHAFCEGLRELGRSRENLHVHDHILRLGGHVFLHGDCANRRMDPAALAAFRESWAADKPRGAFGSALYAAADLTGLSLAFHRGYFRRETTVKRVAHYLDAALPEWRELAGDCYFGHTHLPFRGHRHEGVDFHNTGSAIRGMGFQPMEFEWEENNDV